MNAITSSEPLPAEPSETSGGFRANTDTSTFSRLAAPAGYWAATLATLGLMFGGGCKSEAQALREKAATLPRATPTQVYCEANQWAGKEVVIDEAPVFSHEHSYTTTSDDIIPMPIGDTIMLLPMTNTDNHTDYYYTYFATCPGSHLQEKLTVVSDHPLAAGTVKVMGEVRRGDDHLPYLKVSGSFYVNEMAQKNR